MKIWIDSSAFKTDSENLLPEGALFGMKYLQKSGCILSFRTDDISARQRELILNEQILSAGFEPDSGEGIIKKEDELELVNRKSETVAAGSDWIELSDAILFPQRKAALSRKTNETNIEISVNLDGKGHSEIDTGLSFFDHMLDQLSRHGLVDLTLSCNGDLNVDEHHTIEDTAIALGNVLSKAVNKNKVGIQRYGFVLPMDEAEATVSIDLSDRPYLKWDVNFKREYIGDFPTEMAEHFFHTLAMNLKATIHIQAEGKNEHHVIEAVFKGFARAFRFAISRNERMKDILPTTKGTI
ncbi:MAG: imidazoleglycerol-phosphate dehydratase HisB [Balneolaceae bacterium]